MPAQQAQQAARQRPRHQPRDNPSCRQPGHLCAQQRQHGQEGGGILRVLPATWQLQHQPAEEVEQHDPCSRGGGGRRLRLYQNTHSDMAALHYFLS